MGALCAILVIAPFTHVRAAGEADKEYLVKAAFLYNFIKFVEWPAPLAVSKQSSVNVCIVGSNPFGTAANDVFRKASTGTLTFNVVEKSWKGDASGCHMLFIGRSESAHAGEIIAALKSQPVLTVSEIENFARDGGMIGFVMQDKKVKIIVNTVTATAAGLRVDAQLLEIALSVIRG